MYCIPITGPSFSKALEQVQKAGTGCIEVQSRLLTTLSTEELQKLMQATRCSVLFALRQPVSRSKLRELASLLPTYFDIDDSLPFPKEIQEEFSSIQWILSHHDYESTPEDLESLLNNMKKRSSDLYKIACQGNSTNDALRMMQLVKESSNLLGISMGEDGIITRILSPIFGNPWTFAFPSKEQQSAPGQMMMQEMESIYSLAKRTRQSRMLGLIGGKVTQSLSDQTHNFTMRKLNLDAVYVKMRVEPDELESFLELAKRVGFHGLSVTMPLKEKILPLLDEVSKEAKIIGATNTLHLKQGRWIGSNTDGRGALDAIETRKRVADQTGVVIGAGGAARAIVYEAKKRGAKVTVLNRTLERAQQLASDLGVASGRLDEVDQIAYDFLINTTPHPMPISSSSIRPKTICMDIKTSPRKTDFLLAAEEKECELVYGYEMYVNQAVLQFLTWFGPELDKEAIRKALLEAVEKNLNL